ncbi:MAG: hypothetical protein JNG84_00025, partial [Archangium sp.]|nr:hypothetical protein [Archangium sp.]
MTPLIASLVFALSGGVPPDTELGDDERHAEQHRGRSSVSVAMLYGQSGFGGRGPGVLAGWEPLRWDHVSLALDAGFLSMDGRYQDAMSAQRRGWLAPTLRAWIYLGRARLEAGIGLSLLVVSTTTTAQSGGISGVGAGIGLQAALGLSVVVWKGLDVFLRGFGQLS